MISPWTKPGTKVVVGRDTGTGPYMLPQLHVGLIVTIDRMVDCTNLDSAVYGEILVAIKEIDHSKLYPRTYGRWWRRRSRMVNLFYERRSFNALNEAERPESLPESITRYLTEPQVAPVADKVMA